MQRERWLWCGTISGAIKQHTFLIASASNKSLPISRTKKPKNGVAIRVGRPSTNPLRLHHDELRVVIIEWKQITTTKRRETLQRDVRPHSFLRVGECNRSIPDGERMSRVA